jgi:hypothetical protein
VDVMRTPSPAPSSMPVAPPPASAAESAADAGEEQVTGPAPAAAEAEAPHGRPAASAAVPVPVTPAATSAAAAVAAGGSTSLVAAGSPSAAGLTVSSASPGRLPAADGVLGASPGVLGTSPLEGFYGIGTPSGAAAGSGSSLALALGLQLSTCRGLLKAGMEPAEALAAFESQRLTAGAWGDQGPALLQQEGGEALVVRLGDALYSWQQAAPLLLGLLAFGTKLEVALGTLPADPVLPLKLPITKTSSLEKKVGRWLLQLACCRLLQNSGQTLVSTPACRLANRSGAGGAPRTAPQPTNHTCYLDSCHHLHLMAHVTLWCGLHNQSSFGVSSLQAAAAASSWRLWPFSGWRETAAAAGASTRGSTPPLPPAAAGALGSGTASRAASAPPAADTAAGQGSTSSVVSPLAASSASASALEGAAAVAAAAEGMGSSPSEPAGSGMPRVGSRSNMSGASPRRKA